MEGPAHDLGAQAALVPVCWQHKEQGGAHQQMVWTGHGGRRAELAAGAGWTLGGIGSGWEEGGGRGWALCRETRACWHVPEVKVPVWGLFYFTQSLSRVMSPGSWPLVHCGELNPRGQAPRLRGDVARAWRGLLISVVSSRTLRPQRTEDVLSFSLQAVCCLALRPMMLGVWAWVRLPPLKRCDPHRCCMCKVCELQP